jgi:hypothetical protein
VRTRVQSVTAIPIGRGFLGLSWSCLGEQKDKKTATVSLIIL